MRVSVSIWLAACLLLSASAVLAASTLDAYREKGVTIVHAFHAHPYYYEGEDGQAKGLLVDYWKKWSEKTGIPVTFRTMPWKESLNCVLSGECDIHAGLLMTEGRHRDFDFSQPVFPVEAVLIVQGTSPKACENVYSTMTIGAVAGGYTGDVILERHPEAKVATYENPEAILNALIRNEIEAVSMDIPTFYFNNSKQSPPMHYTVCETLHSDVLRAGVKKGRTELVDVINAGLSSISDGERQQIERQWFVRHKGESVWDEVRQWVLPVTLVLGIVLYGVIRRLSRHDARTGH